jgi:transposase-like protein
MANSHLPVDVWVEYAKCMILGFSIRKSAKACDVSVKTSFYMRHRLLDAVREYQGIGNVSGIVEMDETFLPESFKGNHKKSKFVMPRKSRKRGKEVKKRGISSEQVCISTAIDRSNNIVMEMVTKGRIKTVDLERLYVGHLNTESVICTDSHKNYIQFADKHVSEHIKIASGKHKNGIYHIAHINSLHSSFKRWMKPFNGVATKYLANYLHWFKWLQYASNEKDTIKAKHFLIDSATELTDTRLEQYSNRKPNFV